MNLDKLFKQYEASHTHPWNRRFHLIGIPAIAASILWLIFDWSGQGSFPSTAWYLFIFGWACQFAGHALERTLPEFVKNPIFIIVGPLYFVKKILKK